MLDLSLYLVTDRTLSRGRTHEEIIGCAIRGGVTCIQFRDKELNDHAFFEEAVHLHTLLLPLDIPLIINDRVHIAQKIGAEGVHIGQTDMRIAQARAIMGENAIIGVSAESVPDALQAEQEGADYIGISPVFSTATKQDTAPPLGLAGIRSIRKKTTIPLVAIGGISHSNAQEVITAGADGLAVVSAICAQPDVEEASRILLADIETARRTLPFPPRRMARQPLQPLSFRKGDGQ